MRVLAVAVWGGAGGGSQGEVFEVEANEISRLRAAAGEHDQGSGRKSLRGKGRPAIREARMTTIPRQEQLSKRGRERLVVRRRAI